MRLREWFFWVLRKRNKATVKSGIHSSSFWPIAAWMASACIGQTPSAVKRVSQTVQAGVRGGETYPLPTRRSLMETSQKGPNPEGQHTFREYYLLSWWTGIKHLFCGRHSSRHRGNGSENTNKFPAFTKWLNSSWWQALWDDVKEANEQQAGTPQQSSGQESGLPMQVTRVPSLVRQVKILHAAMKTEDAVSCN